MEREESQRRLELDFVKSFRVSSHVAWHSLSRLRNKFQKYLATSLPSLSQASNCRKTRTRRVLRGREREREQWKRNEISFYGSLISSTFPRAPDAEGTREERRRPKQDTKQHLHGKEGKEGPSKAAFFFHLVCCIHRVRASQGQGSIMEGGGWAHQIW